MLGEAYLACWHRAVFSNSVNRMDHGMEMSQDLCDESDLVQRILAHLLQTVNTTIAGGKKVVPG